MDGLALLSEATAAGLTVLADGDRLVVRGPRFAEPMARRLLEHKAAVLAALDAELAARFAGWVRRPDVHGRMVWQVPDQPEAVPFEALPLPGLPCPRCGSLEEWTDSLGRRR